MRLEDFGKYARRQRKQQDEYQLHHSGDLLDCQSAVISLGLLAHHHTSAFSNTQRSTQKSLTASIAFTSMYGHESTP
jgi:hypothetical protein